MAFKHLITIALMLQFALVAAVPCRCVAADTVGSGPIVAGSGTGPGGACCLHQGCGGGATEKSVPESEADGPAMQCGKSPGRSTCPGRLLPDLAPPPLDDEQFVLLAASHVSVQALCSDMPAVLPADPIAAAECRSRAAPRFRDQSLLRLHCALIV